MKKFLTKSLILVFGLGMAMSFTSCHSEGSSVAEEKKDVTVQHSISGTILNADGTPLTTNASVKIDGKSVAVIGNAFNKKGLSDGNFVVEITCNGYKSLSEVVSLKAETIDGKKTAQNVEKVYYLSKEVTTSAQTITGSAQAGDKITIETTEHSDADGDKANTTDESITVQAETPTVTGNANDPTTDLGDINKQIKDQSNGAADINDFKITLTNITSLEDAQAVAKANKIAAARVTRATTAMPDNNELLAGVAVNAGPYAVTLRGGASFTVTIKMPDDVKNAISLYRTFKGDSWTKIDMNNPVADGIKSIDITTSGVVKIELSKVQTQSFGFGVEISKTSEEPQYEEITADPFENGSTASKVSDMKYFAKSGVVLTQSTKSALTDFLRKIVVRNYGTRIVKEAKVEPKFYYFSPAYQMHANGILYLLGWQTVTKTNFSIKNSNAAFTATEYGDAFFAPYEVWTEIDEPVVHGGGSN